MSKLISLLLFVGMLFCMTACDVNKTETNPTDNISVTQNDAEIDKHLEATLVEMTSSGEISYDLYRTTLVPHMVSDYYDIISPEWFPFEYKSTYGYADANGNVMIHNTYRYASHFTEDKAVVQTNDKIWHIIDTQNNILLDFPEGVDFKYPEQLFFRNGNLVATQQYQANDSKGSEMRLKIIHVDNSLNLSVEDICLGRYGTTGWNSDSSYVVNTNEFKGVVSRYLYGSVGFGVNVYNLDGNVVYSYLPEAIDLTARAISNSGISFYASSTSIENLIFINDGYINVVNEAGLWGMMNINTKEMLIDYKYDYLGGYSEDPIVACRYGKWGCIDKTDKTIIEFQFACIQSFSGSRAFAITADETFCVIDNQGEIIGVYSDMRTPTSYCHYANTFNQNGITTIYSQNGSSKTYTHLVTDTGRVLRSSRISYLSDNYVLIDGKLYQITLSEE